MIFKANPCKYFMKPKAYLLCIMCCQTPALKTKSWLCFTPVTKRTTTITLTKICQKDVSYMSYKIRLPKLRSVDKCQVDFCQCNICPGDNCNTTWITLNLHPSCYLSNVQCWLHLEVVLWSNPHTKICLANPENNPQLLQLVYCQFLSNFSLMPCQGVSTILWGTEFLMKFIFWHKALHHHDQSLRP